MTVVLARAMVTAPDPLYELPDRPVPIVRAFRFDPRATPEIVLFVSAMFGMLVNGFDAPDIDLFVRVWVPVSVTTVLSMAIVTAAEPSYEVPLRPVPMVKACGFAAVIVPEAPKATVTPL